TPTDGAAGGPDLGGGAGGMFYFDCSLGGGGAPGANGANGDPGAGATRQGTVTDAGWVPASGELGTAGHVGQGGGGGRGSLESGGGGGGAGGCGGGPGSYGTGGGGSIALLLFNASVSLVDSELVSAQGGDGGSGTIGQLGMSGGAKGLRSQSTACDGGDGGRGGRGGLGGGGAGGISAAIVYSGPAPTVTSSVLTPGSGGAAGPAWTGGNPGVAGLSVAIHDAN
ncbi:MAG: PE-PGRS family protein, partial [Polyangiaceae bacterium]